MIDRIAVHMLAAVLVLTIGGEAFADCRSFAGAPKKFGNMDLLLHKKLSKREGGVVIKFGGQGQILSVFKFENGDKVISDALLQDELKGLSGAIRYATEQRGDEVVASRVLPEWTIGRRQFFAETMTATYKNYDVTAFEYVGLSHDTKCFFKVRFTNASDADDASSLNRYKSYVEQAHDLLLKPEEFVAEKEDVPAEEPAEEKTD